MSRLVTRTTLWEADPHCHWCGKETKLVRVENGILPQDAATVDHVVHKYDQEHPDQRLEKVLACYRCNHRRGRERDLEFYHGPRKGVRKDVWRGGTMDEGGA